MTAEFDQLVAEFEKFQAQLQNMDDRFEQLAGMQGELAELEVTATSPDRSVTVVAGPGGAVRDIRVTEEALQLGAQRLSGLLMSVLRDAVADAARQQAGIVEEYAGGPVLDQVLETQSEVTGVPVDELREKVPRRPEPVSEDAAPVIFEDAFPDPNRREPTTSAGDSYLRDLADEED
jgi:DNA-binding protein YbaB